MNSIRSLAAGAVVAVLMLSGCHISEHKNGANKDVDISTPFGGMHVKTDDKTNNAAIGITPYPGAVPFKDKDNSSADVNLSFGDFHLGVKAASYKSTDSDDKILAFYKKDLARYGEVLTCRGHSTIGQPARTSQGLTCNDKDKSHITVDDHDSNGNVELRAGSVQHQHIVGVDPRDGFVKIGLVALDLPKISEHHADADTE